MRGGKTAILAAAVLVGLAGPASSFGTVDSWLLNQDPEHENITREALKGVLEPFTLDELAGKKGTFGAVGAPDNPVRQLMDSARNHCDGADWYDESDYPQSRADARKHLEECRDYLFSQLEKAAQDAGDLVARQPDGRWEVRADQMPTPERDCIFLGTHGRAKCNVLEDMGLALHAAQDFYSHSNWADVSKPGKKLARDNPRGLGNHVAAPWLDPDQAGAPFPDGLISGCYDGTPEFMNCNFGFWKWSRVKHSYLNKDSARTSRAEIGENYKWAVNDAVLDSRAKWRWLETEIRRRYPVGAAAKIICALRSDSPDSCNG